LGIIYLGIGGEYRTFSGHELSGMPDIGMKREKAAFRLILN
jgi:hypothetical protein